MMSEEAKYFPVKLEWTGRKTGRLSVEGKATISTGVPTVDDEISGHSPEDLFVEYQRHAFFCICIG